LPVTRVKLDQAAKVPVGVALEEVREVLLVGPADLAADARTVVIDLNVLVVRTDHL
jgi:hypothetical protein